MSGAAKSDFDVREQIAHIDQMLADAARKRQETELAPRLYRLEVWKVVVTAAGGGAALFAAGAAFMKLVSP